MTVSLGKPPNVGIFRTLLCSYSDSSEKNLLDEAGGEARVKKEPQHWSTTLHSIPLYAYPKAPHWCPPNPKMCQYTLFKG